MRTVQDASAVVGRDLELEGVLEVYGTAIPAPQLAAGGVWANLLQSLFQQIPVLREPWGQLNLEQGKLSESLPMDFITHLIVVPETKSGHTSTFVVVDRF